MNLKLLISFMMAGLLFSCAPDESILLEEEKPTLPSNTHKYGDIILPAYFEFMSVDATTGDIEDSGIPVLMTETINDDAFDDKATLGRVLFYDKKLSLNNTVSCGSCHSQSAGFADPVAASRGFKGQLTDRNSMSIANPFVNNSFFWDSRTHDLETLILQPVANHIEMGMEELDKLNIKLAGTSYYPELFEKAFGSDNITSFKISEAMSTFLKSMVAKDAKFDQGMESDFANFTAEEMLGKEIFYSAEAKCGTCHSGANFSSPDGNFNFLMRFSESDIASNPSLAFITGDEYNQTLGTANIGLEMEYEDQGRRNGQFKIPSLRNIEVTGPYMHDGRFATLEEVVDHYDRNIQPHQHLDRKFRNSSGIQALELTSDEKRALVAFMKTLTDDALLRDEKFSNPF